MPDSVIPSTTHENTSICFSHRRKRRAVASSSCSLEPQPKRSLARRRPSLPHTSRPPPPPRCREPWLPSCGPPAVTAGPGPAPSRARCREPWAWSLCTESLARWISTSPCLHQLDRPARPHRWPSGPNPSHYPERGEPALPNKSVIS